MWWLHAKSYLQLQLMCKDIWIFLSLAIFKSRLIKVAANVMTVEFGTINHYSSLEKNSDAYLCSSLDRYKKLTELYVNCDILV